MYPEKRRRIVPPILRGKGFQQGKVRFPFRFPGIPVQGIQLGGVARGGTEDFLPTERERLILRQEVSPDPVSPGQGAAGKGQFPLPLLLRGEPDGMGRCGGRGGAGKAFQRRLCPRHQRHKAILPGSRHFFRPLPCRDSLHMHRRPSQFNPAAAVFIGFQYRHRAECGGIHHIQPHPCPGNRLPCPVLYGNCQELRGGVAGDHIVQRAAALPVYGDVVFRQGGTEKAAVTGKGSPAGRVRKPAPIQHRFRLTGAEIVPVPIAVSLHPGMVVVTVGPEGHVNLPGGNADTPQSGDREHGLLPAPSDAAAERRHGAFRPAVGGLIGHLLGAPAVHLQNGLPGGKPRRPGCQPVVEKPAAVHKIFGIDPGTEHIVEEKALRQFPAEGAVLPQKQGMAHVGQDGFRRHGDKVRNRQTV